MKTFEINMFLFRLLSGSLGLRADLDYAVLSLGLCARHQSAALLSGVPAPQSTHLLHVPDPSGNTDCDRLPDGGSTAPAAHHGDDHLSGQRGCIICERVHAVRAVRSTSRPHSADILQEIGEEIGTIFIESEHIL